MRNDIMDLSEAISIENMKAHGLEVGMQVEVLEQKSYARPEREHKETGIKPRSIRGEVLAVNDRIFTLKTETFRRIESFHLSDLFRPGGISVRVRS